MKDFTGEILEVKVVEENPKYLLLQIKFSGFAGGNIKVEILDNEKLVISEINGQSLSLPKNSKQVQIRIGINDDMKEKKSLLSSFLRIRLGPNRRLLPAMSYLYSTQKLWRNWLKPDEVVTKVTPRPIGSAKGLRKDVPQFTTLPSKAIRVYTLPKYHNLIRAEQIRPWEPQVFPNPVKPRPQTGGSSPQRPNTPSAGTSGGWWDGVVITSQISDTLITEATDFNNQVLGPSDVPISLWEGLSADVDFEFQQEISNIQFSIFPDQNKNSGIYYYLPAGYTLRWNPYEGYDFLISDRGGDAKGEEVYMGSTLSPSMGTQEVEFIKALLEKYIEETEGMKFKQLRPMPMKDQAKVSLEKLGLFDILPENIVVSMSSNMQDPIDISIKASQDAYRDIDNALRQNLGIRGTITFKPLGDNLPEQQIPIRIVLADQLTFGRMTLEPGEWRKSEWKNQTPFPLRVKNIHYLLINEKSNFAQPVIYSWDIQNEVIQPQGKIAFDPREIPKWLDNYGKAKRIWMDYSVVECDSCMESILQRVLPKPKITQSINFDILSIFEETGASKLRIRVRSKYADPQDSSTVELKSLRITEDEAIYEMGPLYIPEGKNPEYEYFLSLVMPNGKIYSSQSWTFSDEWEVSIGVYTLHQLLEEFPPQLNKSEK